MELDDKFKRNIKKYPSNHLYWTLSDTLPVLRAVTTVRLIPILK